MKKQFTLMLLLSLFAVTGIYAQCTPDFTLTSPTLRPSYDSLPCIVQGAPYSAQINFQNFTTASIYNIDSLRVDSLTNVPAGICYTANKRIYGPGENGCMHVGGSTMDPTGQYVLGIYITVWGHGPGGSPFPLSGASVPAATLAGFAGIDFRYWLRVSSSGGPCPSVDTGATASNKTSSNPLHANSCPVGISELQNVLSAFDIAPNPSSTSASVSFNSETNGQFDAVVTNVLGEVVSAQKISVSRGENTYNLNVSNFNTGVYFFSIQNGKEVATKRFLVSR